MTVLGNANVNIEDLTLHHFSRAVGGDLELFVSGEEQAAAPPPCSRNWATARWSATAATRMTARPRWSRRRKRAGSRPRRAHPVNDSGPRGFFGPAVRGLRGEVRVPGDKSISHRAVLLGAVNAAPLPVTGFLRSADTLATMDAVRALGVVVEEERRRPPGRPRRRVGGSARARRRHRRAQRGHPHPAAPGPGRVAAVPLRAHRRRQHPPPARWPGSSDRSRAWARPSGAGTATGCRRSPYGAGR